MLTSYPIYTEELNSLPHCKLIINTINAHSYNISKIDSKFEIALKSSDILLPDGISVVLALRWLKGEKIKKIAGEDLFYYEMTRANQLGGRVFFLGSSENTLELIRQKIVLEFPAIEIGTYSPPFKPVFSELDNSIMINAINLFKPDILFIGMTAPKQEKWVFENKMKLDAGHICSIGAVFDFYAGTVNRAPKWMIRIGMEWLYRLIQEPKRMWRRYVLGNLKFIYFIIDEKINGIK